MTTNTSNETALEIIERFRGYHVPTYGGNYPPADIWGDGRLWIGSAADALNTEWLKARQITHVVNCAEGLAGYARRVADAGVREVLVLEAQDDREYPILHTHLDDVARFCDGAFQTGAAEGYQTRILIHCMAGVNRSAALGLAYAATASLGAASRAERLAYVFVRVMRQRPIILTNDSFYNQLLIWAQL